MKMDKKFLIKAPKHLKEIVLLERKKHHPKIHEIHVKHGISKRTLFYMKEYGPHSHLVSTIFKESLLVLLFASVISSVGGIGLESIQSKIFVLIPLLIFIPALNDFIGDLGIIVSSRFTTMLYLGGTAKEKRERMKRLAHTVYSIALIMSVYVGVLSCTVAYFKGYLFDVAMFAKILLIAVTITLVMTTIIFAVSTALGFYIFKKGEDPNNFLIPITTSIADFGCLLVFTALVFTMF